VAQIVFASEACLIACGRHMVSITGLWFPIKLLITPRSMHPLTRFDNI